MNPTGTELDALATKTLAAYPLDLPFLLLYRAGPKAGSFELEGSAGAGPELLDPHPALPFEQVVRTGRPVVVELEPSFGAFRAGPDAEQPKQAVALPIIPPGHKTPALILLAGVSARRTLDDSYLGFYDLLGAAVTTSVANASAPALSAREQALLEREQSACAEAELQKQHLADLFTQAPTPILVLKGSRQVIELANRAALQLWGRSCEEVINRPLLEVAPELRDQAFPTLLDEVYRTGRTRIGKETPALLDRSGNGVLERVVFNYVYAPLRAVDRTITGVLALAFDVTDEIRAREQMGRLRAEAEAASKSKDEFLAMLSHELRNPLAPLQTSLQLIRRKLPRSPVDRQLEVIGRQADHLERMVDDLLEVSRIRLGKIDLREERLDLNTAVSRALESLREAIGARGHEVSVALPVGPTEVFADAIRIEQVLNNLLTNALKYTDPGGRIWVTVAAVEGQAELRIRDNGIGIAEQLRTRVFGLFEQGSRDLSRSEGGLGIGLTIARRLVELHGGQVEAHSDGPGKGSEFVVRLPLAPDDWASATPAPRASPPPPPPARHCRVLVVDDNQDAAEAMQELVTDLGHEVKTACDGPSALSLCEQWPPDLVFLDIGLPGMDGYQVARALNQAPRAHPSLVAITGYTQQSDREKALEAGFRHYLSKPTSLEAIEEIVLETARELDGGARPQSSPR